MKRSILFLLLFTIFMVACQSETSEKIPTMAVTAVVSNLTPSASAQIGSAEMPVTPIPDTLLVAIPSISPANLIIPTATVPSTSTPLPTHTATVTATPTAAASPTATVEPSATYWPTVTRQVLAAAQTADLVPCTDRPVTTALLTMVTQQFSLPQSFAPADLQPLSDYFSDDVLLGKDHYARAAIIEPLQQIIAAMNGVGLQPSILSAYRSYNEQEMAWRWWGSQYPGRVAIMSARAGHSEHQLGDTVDFGSPEIKHLFHVDFAQTAEGVWLADNAHHYGFTLSYPADSYAVTGFKYEPWHYRYVGVELATQLYQSGQILTEWQLHNLPLPCIP